MISLCCRTCGCEDFSDLILSELLDVVHVDSQTRTNLALRDSKQASSQRQRVRESESQRAREPEPEPERRLRDRQTDRQTGVHAF
jgi:hypothetical protein